MNNLISYKQFSLGPNLADLFNEETLNLEQFKASIMASAKSFCNMFGYSECYNNNWKDNTTWKENKGHKEDC